MRPALLLVAALVLSSLTPAFASEPPGAEPAAPERHRPAPGFPNIAFLTSLDGVAFLGDSTEMRTFVSGLREAFDPDHYLTEAVGGGPPRVTLALGNRFRLAQGDPFGDEWQVRVRILGRIHEPGSLAPHPGVADSTGAGRATSGDGPANTQWGLRVSVAVLSPDSAEAGTKTVAESLLFQVPIEPRADWLSHAGRMVGLLAVEALHHQSGDLEPDTRIRLDRTARTPIVEPPALPPHR